MLPVSTWPRIFHFKMGKCDEREYLVHDVRAYDMGAYDVRAYDMGAYDVRA